MKKFVAMLLLAVMLFSCSSAMAERMVVHITSLCYDTNRVGTKWAGTYMIGDTQIVDGMVVDLIPGEYQFYTEIGEYDMSPDIGVADTMYNVTANRLEKGFTVEQYLTVTENKGVYKGYWCEWYIYLDFSPIGDAMVLQ